ncbi:hypothetical protein [Bacillus massiliglaciei]|uniref:hypothetical protein n=1 Tax=Bacillus massiliglaciei TaxID=1816693 RepID=UPI000DA62D41|nr:hypothetical protein [Bacillus massiliglaciei]
MKKGDKILRWAGILAMLFLLVYSAAGIAAYADGGNQGQGRMNRGEIPQMNENPMDSSAAEGQDDGSGNEQGQTGFARGPQGVQADFADNEKGNFGMKLSQFSHTVPGLIVHLVSAILAIAGGIFIWKRKENSSLIQE